MIDSEVDVGGRDSEPVLHAGVHKVEVFRECVCRRDNSFFSSSNLGLSRSQWPRDLMHELSSLARTLRSWVRNPLKTWMSVLCTFILCLCCSVCR
jgi:hypothetical protein